jgi:hypothetical protein
MKFSSDNTEYPVQSVKRRTATYAIYDTGEVYSLYGKGNWKGNWKT